MDEIKILHSYDHLEETNSQVQHHQIDIDGLEQHVGELEQRVRVSEISVIIVEVIIGYL